MVQSARSAPVTFFRDTHARRETRRRSTERESFLTRERAEAGGRGTKKRTRSRGRREWEPGREENRETKRERERERERECAATLT